MASRHDATYEKRMHLSREVVRCLANFEQTKRKYWYNQARFYWKQLEETYQ